MLKHEDFTREFPVDVRGDRDAEIPVLVEFIQKIAPIESLLDIGAHTSAYSSLIRPYIKRYDGVDILDDPGVGKILDNYYVGNANTFHLDPHEAVVCVSTLEHAGVSTYKANYMEERDGLFKRCLELAKRYIWISFPVGREYIYPDELAIISRGTFEQWKNLLSDFEVTQRFFYSQGPQAGHPWHEHNKEEVALKIPYIDYIGNQSICVLEVEKRKA